MKLKPKHSFESVVNELIEGLEDGSVTIPGSKKSSPSADDLKLVSSISDKFTEFLRFDLNSFAADEKFADELQNSYKNAKSRIWLCAAYHGSVPGNFALMKREHEWLDMRLILPWNEVENNRSLVDCTRIFDYEFPRLGSRLRVQPITLLLLIVDDVAYCRFSGRGDQRLMFDFDYNVGTRNWSSLIFKIDAEHRETFEICEYMFRHLWDDNELTKPAIYALEE